MLTLLDFHQISRFACNTRMIADASSNPPFSRVKLFKESLQSNHQINKQTLCHQSISQSNGNSISWSISSSSGLVNKSVGIM